MDCPICSGAVHLANVTRYRGCCSDGCRDIFEAWEERNQLRQALEAAVEQAHHADGCKVRYRQDCTCWREPARRLVEAYKQSQR